MKAAHGALILFLGLSGCSRGMHQRITLRTADPTNEVKSLLAGLEGRPIWWSSEGTSRAASNRLVQLKHIAVPMLLDKLSSLNFRDFAEPERFGLACAILGTNAYPVLKQAAKGVDAGAQSGFPLDENVFIRTAGCLLILQQAGPCSLGPVVDVVEQEVNPDSYESGQRRSNLKQLAMNFMEDHYPAEFMGELLWLYQHREKRAVLREYISSALRDAIYCQDSNRLDSVIKSQLLSGDDFLVVEALAFLKRCERVSPALRNDVTPLLSSSNPQIRIEATNVVNLPASAP